MDTKLNYLILDLYDEAQNCPVDEFTDRSLGKLKKYLKFDSAGIASFSTAPNGDIHAVSAYVYRQPTEKITFRHSNIPTGKLKPDGVMVSRDPMIASCWQDRGRCRYTALADMAADSELKSYNKRFETIQIMTVALKNSTFKKADYVSLWRAGTRDVFEKKDAQMGNLLLPHLNKAIAINKKIVNPLNSGVVLIFCSKEGFIHFIDDLIIKILQEEWSQWVPPILPPKFIAEILASASRQYLGRAITARAEMNNGFVILRVTLNPIGKALTPSELKVAFLVDDGLSYKEIARILNVSPATIRNQLHSIYKKMEISGKAALSNILKTQRLRGYE